MKETKNKEQKKIDEFDVIEEVMKTISLVIDKVNVLEKKVKQLELNQGSGH